ncbi:MAG: type I 3-dehydroquinate dehydratase [Verrucomicrobia bacterium]|nr:type I 3-dehydroquinate dehydratase [Verrucomicrobiota bacterium]
MLCVSTCLKDDVEAAKKYGCAVEMRLSALEELPEAMPTMLTIMDPLQVDLALSLAALGPEWLSLPWDMPLEVFQTVKANWPQVKIIAAYHDFEKTGGLDQIYALCREIPCDMIKMVTMANSSLDSLRMMVFLKEHADEFLLTAFCMGTFGSFSRVMAPTLGSQIAFCSLPGKPTAPGQLSVEELLQTYHYHSLTRKTKLFALIGSPIDHSLSYITHNALFRKVGADAVYVKIPLERHEFEEGFTYLSNLGITGLSVTRPLKDCFTPLANTVRCFKDQIETCTTDGVGMGDALEQYGALAGKRAIVLGAGPTASAIIQELLLRGADVFIANRTEEKAKKMAEHLGCLHVSWDLPSLLTQPYDILVNATSVGMVGEESSLPIEEIYLRQTAIVADVISSGETALLQMAKKRGCTIVTGREMWLRQAAHQFHFWDSSLRPADVLPILREIMPG